MSKAEVIDFWDRASCGEELYLSEGDYQAQADERYRLEPYIKTFIEPERWSGAKVLEIGVGLGADHQLLAESGAVLSGVDLTPRAIQHTKERFRRLGLKSDLRVADAENLPFEDATFDMVYSWGVIHHSPDTYKSVREIFRVLKPNGTMKVMIYHKWSLIGLMLWLRYGLAIGRPWRSLDDIYACHLESPGTKAYSRRYARETLFMNTPGLKIATLLTHGDLLESEAGQRHRGALLTLARRLWPRWFFRRFFPDSGLFMLIEARKYAFGDPHPLPELSDAPR
ncbi:class I SAM-dependent methyltransferase [Nitratireductor sp. StC3]|uniref:class I SAM-dependent methyltransferase n=1 Tax=Nitratireductor sp. StC3 TaxID=2126741 RepID=UPI0018ED9FC4|nr:class I SAM-dependent methyltransferase [Nitratireductor sp. StC3]